MQLSNETSSPNPSVCPSVLPEGAEVDSRLCVSYGTLLTVPLVGGQSECTCVFSHGTTLTQAPLISLVRNIVAVQSGVGRWGKSGWCAVRMNSQSNQTLLLVIELEKVGRQRDEFERDRGIRKEVENRP